MKKAAKSTKFPDRMFIKPMRDDARGESYYLTETSSADLAEGIGKTIEVGEYRLVRVRQVTTKVVVSP